MKLSLLPLVVAFACSILLVAKTPARLFPIIALAGCVLELLRAFAILSLKVPLVGAPLLFGALIVIGGAGSWTRAGSKPMVTAATVIAVVGVLLALPVLA